jgi:hypothetical protein
MTRALRLAVSAAAALVTGSFLLRLVNPSGAPEPQASDLVPHLWGVGALLLVLLTHAWAPTLAWCSLVIGSAASALGVVGLVREVRAERPGDPAPLLGALVVVALLVPPALAAAYATHDGRRPRFVAGGAWLAVAMIGSILAFAFLVRTLGGERGGMPEWAWDGVIAEGERGRIAADLHAEVLPSLRRALTEAEAGGTVERLAADLRTAVDEVESLLAARRSIVLEELGLLAAVEWLAERVEDRSDVRVEIEVGPSHAVGGRPAREVERAAFRVTQLALDNVVRHAPGATARILVTSSAREVRLVIEDDGDGPPIDEDAATRRGRRGIADMRAEARACGASLEVGRRPGGTGTAVELRWPAA